MSAHKEIEFFIIESLEHRHDHGQFLPWCHQCDARLRILSLVQSEVFRTKPFYAQTIHCKRRLKDGI